MHILEQYALNCGLKIDKPYIYTQYFPLGVSDYITIQPFSNAWSKGKAYDYWSEVIEYIFPALEEKGIKIVQIGGKEEQPLPKAIWTQGSTTISQAAFLISGSMLHMGADSFGTHIASAFDKKIVSLYSTNWIKNCNPYWTKDEDCVLIQPDRSERKPSFKFVDTLSKNINEIKPEKIASSILGLLGLDSELPYETLFVGDAYIQFGIHTVPSSVSSLGEFEKGLQHLIIRMDLDFNPTGLIKQMDYLETCSIITDKPIDPEIIKTFKSKIKDIVYLIDEEHDIDFVKYLHTGGTNYVLLSYLEEEKLNKIKFDYLDYNFIFGKKVPEKDKDEILKHPVDKLLFKSNKKIFHEGKVYPSIASMKAGQTSESLTSKEFLPLLDTKEFWKQLEDFYIVKKLD